MNKAKFKLRFNARARYEYRDDQDEKKVPGQCAESPEMAQNLNLWPNFL